MKATRLLNFTVLLPDATAFTVGGKPIALKDGKGTFAVNTLQYLGGIDAADAAKTSSNFTVPMTVTTKSKELMATLNCSTELPNALLSGVRKKGFLLPGENVNRKGHKVMVAPESSKVLGTGTLADVDLVYFLEGTSVMTGTCDYATKEGVKSQGQRIRHDLLATVHERRTGKRLGQKNFEGSTPECKQVVKGNETRSAQGDAAAGNAESWASGFLDK